MHGETSGSDDSTGVAAVGVAHRNVSSRSVCVDESHVCWSQSEVTTLAIMHEDAVAAAQRVPLEAKHHDRRVDGSSAAPQGSHSHHSPG